MLEVTRFFRDPEAFQILYDRIIPQIVDHAGTTDEIRVWVPGCATGEEAYSIAMLFQEHLELNQVHRTIKIFATDIHQQSLNIASAGSYNEQALQHLPEGYLEKYFEHLSEKYRVRKKLRQMVIFAPHNLILDPPFTKLDLISCRNVLINFQQSAQQWAFSRFHFGLKDEGFLILGTSEHLGKIEEAFRTVNRRWRIYSKWREVRQPEILSEHVFDAASEKQEHLNNLERELLHTKKSLQSTIEELETTNEELQSANEELIESNKELENFAYTVSHDLRAPLRAMKGYSAFLQEDYGDQLDEEGAEFIQGIYENANRLDQLLQDLLAYSRVGRREEPFSTVHIQQVVNDNIEITLETNSCQFDIPDDLPIIESYPTRIQQIFSNLLSNAVKYSQEVPFPKISISWEDRGDSYAFSIQDNGIGIDEKHFDRIFGVFQRLHTDEEYEGTGIGLAIVKKAILQLGGEIKVTSKLNEGSTFTFTIPKVKNVLK